MEKRFQNELSPFSFNHSTSTNKETLRKDLTEKRETETTETETTEKRPKWKKKKKKRLLREERNKKTTTKITVMSTRYKAAESHVLPGNEEKEMLASVETKHKMMEKPSPNYVVEREFKENTTQQLSLCDKRTPSSPRKQQGQNWKPGKIILLSKNESQCCWSTCSTPPERCSPSGDSPISNS